MAKKFLTDITGPGGDSAFVLAKTRSEMDTLAGSSGIVANQVYRITDEDRLAVGLTTTTYVTYLKEDELSAGGKALGALSYSSGTIGYATSSSAAATTSLTTFGRSLIDDVNATAARATLGITGAFAEKTGTPANNYLAVWTDANTIEGKNVLTWDETLFTATVPGTTVGFRLTNSTSSFDWSYAGATGYFTNYGGGIAFTAASGNITVTANTGTVVLSGTNRASKISDPSGGATQDAEARTAINAIIDALEAHGISTA